jgi:hypothetical protein
MFVLTMKAQVIDSRLAVRRQSVDLRRVHDTP